MALLRLAWRDLRAFPARSLLLVFALACSIAAVVGVRSAQHAAESVLEGDLRRWLGADLAASTGEPIDAAVLEQLWEWLEPARIRWTWVTWTAMMARSEQSPDPALVVLKVVDPTRYPLYPGFQLEPPQPLGEGIAVSAELLERFRVKRGDSLSIAGRRFKIAAVIAGEADRLNGFPGAALRVIVTREAYRQSGLAAVAGASKNAVLLRLPASDAQALAAARERLQRILPEAAVADYRESNAQAVAAIRLTVSFLGVTALLVFAVGVAGLAAALQRHVVEQMPFIAALKINGATVSQIVAVFAIEVALLLCGAVTLGIPLGVVGRGVAIDLAGGLVDVSASNAPPLTSGGVLETLAGCAAALVLVLPRPMWLIRRVRPMEVLRGTVAGVVNRGWPAWMATGVTCLVLGIAGARIVSTWISAAFLVAALAICVGLAIMLTTATLRLASAAAGRIRTPAVRLGLRNLAHPAHGTASLVVAMAIGLMLILVTFEAHRVVARAVIASNPFEDANLVLTGFEAHHRDEIQAFLKTQVNAPIHLVTQTRMRLAKVDGLPVEQRLESRQPGIAPPSWRDIGCRSDIRPGVIVANDVAGLLGIREGSRLTFETRAGSVDAVVSETREMSRIEKLWYTFSLDCAALDRPSLFHLAAVYVPPQQLEIVRKAVAARFPMVAVLTSGDVADAVVQVSRDALALTRIVAIYAMLASLVVLAAAVAASRRARLRELAVLSALGSKRRTLLQIYTVELAAIGATAALIGSLLAQGFLEVVLHAVLQRGSVGFRWTPAVATMLVASALTVTAGWLPLLRSLQRRPIESLRAEP